MALSRTALIAAAARMEHMLTDGDPPIFDDPIAQRLLGDDAGPLRELLGSLPAAVALPLRAATIARSRVADDRARFAAATGPARYVLLGAGLDSAAWRLGDLDLEVVEIDQRDVLEDKRTRAAAAGLGVPPAARYLPADLATEPIEPLLLRAVGGQPRRTVIAWCGVTQYLLEAAIRATLSAVAALPGGTELVFTTFLPQERIPVHLQSGGRQVTDLTASLGEPYLTRLTPEDTAALLTEAGLALVADMGAEELGALFSGRSDGLFPAEAEHVVIATA